MNRRHTYEGYASISILLYIKAFTCTALQIRGGSGSIVVAGATSHCPKRSYCCIECVVLIALRGYQAGQLPAGLNST